MLLLQVHIHYVYLELAVWFYFRLATKA